jgi:hypothetical protein
MASPQRKPKKVQKIIFRKKVKTEKVSKSDREKIYIEKQNQQKVLKKVS